MPLHPINRTCNGARFLQAWHDVTFGEALDEWSAAYADSVCLVDGTSVTTYRQMRQRSRRLAAFFLGLGLQRGDRVLFRLGNTEQFVFAFLGLLEIGVIPIMLRAGNRLEEMVKLAERAEPVAFVSSDSSELEDTRAIGERLRERCATVRRCVFEHELVEACDRPDYDLDALAYERPKPNDISHLLLSGGTTGVPKMAPHTHVISLLIATCVADRDEDSPLDRALAVLPASHNFTLLNDLFATFVSGGAVVMCAEPSPAEILRLIDEERVTHLSLVPTLTRLCISYRDVDASDDLSSLRFVSEGGAKVPPDLVIDSQRAFGCVMQHVFGTVEGFYSTSYLDDDEESLLSAMTASVTPYDSLKVVGTDGAELPTGELGELLCNGPTRFPGYFNDPEATARAITADGYYRTGDYGFLDDCGRVGIRGRVKEQINRAGESIMPEAIETAVRRHPRVCDCVAVGVADETLGERIYAFVTVDGAEVDVERVRSELRELGVSEHHLPDEVVAVPFFPETSGRKVDKRRLLQMAGVDR